MPYLRCEACGAKALPIATRCPACESPFEAKGPGMVRSGLRACHACDSLVPRESERCRWCDEELGGRLSPRAKSVLVAGVALLLVGGWSFLGSRSPDVVTLTAPPADAPISAPATALLPEPAPTAPAPEAQDSGPAGAAASVSSAPNSAGARASTAPAPAASAPTAAPAAAAARDPRPALPVEPVEGGWVQAVARTFVNVRSAPGSDSEVQGVVAENDVVLLGDARGAWRQVRAGSVAGWAWEPLFQVRSEGP